MVDGPSTKYEQRYQTYNKYDSAVFHDLMCQRKRHTVTCKVEEQSHSHQEDGCCNTHDSETESCSKRLLIREVVLIFKVRFLYHAVKIRNYPQSIRILMNYLWIFMKNGSRPNKKIKMYQNMENN